MGVWKPQKSLQVGQRALPFSLMKAQAPCGGSKAPSGGNGDQGPLLMGPEPRDTDSRSPSILSCRATFQRPFLNPPNSPWRISYPSMSGSELRFIALHSQIPISARVSVRCESGMVDLHLWTGTSRSEPGLEQIVWDVVSIGDQGISFIMGRGRDESAKMQPFWLN